MLSQPELISLVSTCLSYAIVCGSLILKLPQIIKVVRNQSAYGISNTMLILELLSYTIAASYNFSLGYRLETYAENIIILVQNLVLINLVAHFQRQYHPLKGGLGVVLYLLWVGSVIYGVLPLSVTMFLMSFVQIPLGAFSRLPQIYSIYCAKTTGQLTVITFILAGGGCAARVLTTFTGSKDPTLLAGFLLNTFLNGVIVLQFLCYWKNSISGKPLTPKSKDGEKKD